MVVMLWSSIGTFCLTRAQMVLSSLRAIVRHQLGSTLAPFALDWYRCVCGHLAYRYQLRVVCALLLLIALNTRWLHSRLSPVFCDRIENSLGSVRFRAHFVPISFTLISRCCFWARSVVTVASCWWQYAGWGRSRTVSCRGDLLPQVVVLLREVKSVSE